MNGVAIVALLALLGMFGTVLVYALASGTAWLLATLVIGVIALFVRWG